MKRFLPVILAVLVLTAGGASALAFSSGSKGEEFDVTVTNLTRGQQFTPILVVSHKKGVNLFTLGEAASGALATLAETGATGDLAALLMGMPGVNDVVTALWERAIVAAFIEVVGVAVVTLFAGLGLAVTAASAVVTASRGQAGIVGSASVRAAISSVAGFGILIHFVVAADGLAKL